jgi:hypothetical protein
MDCDRLPGTPSSSGSGSRLLLSPVRQPLVIAAVAAGHLALPLHQHESLVLPGRYARYRPPPPPPHPVEL